MRAHHQKERLAGLQEAEVCSHTVQYSISTSKSDSEGAETPGPSSSVVECCSLLDFAGQRDARVCGAAPAMHPRISAAPAVALTTAVQSKAVRPSPVVWGIIM